MDAKENRKRVIKIGLVMRVGGYADDTRESAAIDTITDVLHYAERWKLDPERILRTAAGHYSEESGNSISLK